MRRHFERHIHLQLRCTHTLNSLNRYSQKELYSLVADVDCYRHFLPFCHASKVLHASWPNWKLNPGDGPVVLEAELKIGFLGFEESYISRVLRNPYESVEASIRRCRALDTTTHTVLFSPHNRLARPQPLPYSKLSLRRGGSKPHRQPRRIYRRHLYIPLHVSSVILIFVSR